MWSIRLKHQRPGDPKFTQSFVLGSIQTLRAFSRRWKQGVNRRGPVFRDLKRIDGSMAHIAQMIGLRVSDLDTSGATQ
jgi:hypothetical protein